MKSDFSRFSDNSSTSFLKFQVKQWERDQIAEFEREKTADFKTVQNGVGSQVRKNKVEFKK